MGVAAGKMTKSAKLGFVIGMPIGYALGNVNAFELGARSVNPAARTYVVVTGGWSDKAKEAGAANALLDQGCDVVAMHVDSPATIIQTVEARGGMSIGFQSVEARALAPKGWLTGLGFDLGPVRGQGGQERHGQPVPGRSGVPGPGRGWWPWPPSAPSVPAGRPGPGERRRRQGGQGLQSLHRPPEDNTGPWPCPPAPRWAPTRWAA